MDENKLVNDIKTIVDSIFSEKEQAAQISKTQDALNESAQTIDELTQSLESTKTELETAQENASQESKEKDSKIDELTTELEAAQGKVEKVEAELVSAEESLENMKKDQLAEARIDELKESKVAMTNDLEVQTAKVRDMSEEEFASYKEDRIVLRTAVEKELEEAAVTAAAEAKAKADSEAAASEGQEGGETASEEINTEEDITPPVEVSPGQAMASAMNFESKPSEDMVKKYADLGKSMATLMTTKTDNKEI
ncbi:MAG: hypothetical protein KAH05_08905 [Clostridiales bacterium]|nr:hypothetical protein [Clostridiales bacterium]